VESCCEYRNGPSGSINTGKPSSEYRTGGLLSSAQVHTVSYLVT
jgi:hypothetical protein